MYKNNTENILLLTDILGMRFISIEIKKKKIVIAVDNIKKNNRTETLLCNIISDYKTTCYKIDYWKLEFSNYRLYIDIELYDE